MKQVIQNFKSGELYVADLPLPSLSKNMVLVENQFSLISAGTERSTLKVAQSGILGKARQRPDLVAQVVNNLRKEGLRQTLDKVRTKLDTLKALGYSTSGRVIASMDSNGYFKPGDRVACAGQDYASHAEIVSVPQNLVVKIPDGVSSEEASFTTLGAIAMQGVRQADPKLGEIVCVIGLGLLGQITCQLLKANGCRVMGIDISEPLVALAVTQGADDAVHRKAPTLHARINQFTNGFGFDSVIITAAATSNDPIELAAEITRKKGSVVAVGAVKLDVPRDPHFYRKELDLRMSCSYGPGRYDSGYEEYGNDYPYAYVRWTEQRNMESFLQLLANRKIDMRPLISHTFTIDQATEAYDIVTGKTQQPHIGILLSYPEDEKKFASRVAFKPVPRKQVNAGFIGAGSFAQSYLLPYVKIGGGSLQTVVTSRGITAKNVAEKFGFANASTNPDDIFSDNGIDTVFIATPHNSHGPFVLSALQAKKNVFVEKPLATTEDDLEKIADYYSCHGGNLMVGFNRRFSPLSVKMKSAFEHTGPLVMNYRVNAGPLPKGSWIQNEEVGGGRIIGEVCHFIDLMQYFTGSLPSTVYGQCVNVMNDKIVNQDNMAITITFRDGSVGSVIYTAGGDKSLPKEKLEIFGGTQVGVIDDFRGGQLHQGGRETKIQLEGKGHKEEVQGFLLALREGRPMPIAFESLYYTTKATIKILESVYTGLPQNL